MIDTHVNSIKYFQNIFTPEQNNKIWDNYLNVGRWEYGQLSINNSDNKFWYNELKQDQFFVEELFSSIKGIIGNNFEILKCYANGQTAFQEGDYHIDSQKDDEYTFLYYPMSDWSPEWAGETVFLLPSGDLQYVLPIPNGAVFFPGSWMHCAKAPSSKMPFGLRVTIAYKLKKI